MFRTPARRHRRRFPMISPLVSRAVGRSRIVSTFASTPSLLAPYHVIPPKHHILIQPFTSGAISTGATLNSSRLPHLLGLGLPDAWHLLLDFQSCQPIDCECPADMENKVVMIDGKAIAQKIRKEVAEEVSKVTSQTGKTPGLALVLVGNQKDSATYVRSKKRACSEVGITTFSVHLPENSSEEEVLECIQAYNEDSSVHGILVQLPLPNHINEEKVLAAVVVEKDVDGLHPFNTGKLAMNGRRPFFIPCAPRGCIELLLRSSIDLEGKHVVVIGRSNALGTPIAMLLLHHKATVTVVHSYTPNPAKITSTADVVIVAACAPHLVRGYWIKPGAVIIDAGMNTVQDPSSKKGYKIVGDVCLKEACGKASAIAPVPGGVGPMIIAMLLSNTLDSAKRTYCIS